MATSDKTKKLQLLGGGFATKKQLEEQHIKTYTLKEGETIEDAPDWADEVIDPFAESEGGEGSGEKLTEAINQALAEAKASGEFDGPKGEPGDDYILTESDKTEIAQKAANLIDTSLLSVIGTGEVTA